MRHRWLVLSWVVLALAACAPLRPGVVDDAQAIPGSRDAGKDVAGMDGNRDIVLAVANPLDPPAMHAGSSLLGYVPARHYGVGQRAATLLATLQQRYGWRQIAGWPIKRLGVYCIVLEPHPGTTREALLKALSGDAGVRLAEPLHEYTTYSDVDTHPHHYNDPYANLQLGFVETDAALAHNLTRGQGVRVAVVDTGVDLSHPDLAGRVHSAQNLVDGDARRFRSDRHGTEVAGIIAAVGDNRQGIVGISPDARLDLYKACWYAGPTGPGARCNSFTLAKALAAVLDGDARVVNLSLGGPPDPLLTQLVGQLVDQDRIVVAAMPPQGTSGFPDDVPGVLIVRATARTPAPAGVLSAPGHDILSTEPGGGYDFSSGSSMAAAHVSGIMALLLALDPGLDAQRARTLLLRSSKHTPQGLQVDAAAAVAQARSAVR